MNQVLVSLILATAGAIFLVTVPSEGGYGYNPGYRVWNGTRNSSIPYPKRNATAFIPQPYRSNSSSYYPVHRYPRSSPYWGNSSQNGSHNFFWGHKSIYDRLLYFSRVKKASSFLRKVTLDMDFPAKYQRPNGTISYIEVLDQKPAGEGGEVSIMKGGIGYKNVTFHLKSQRNKGFDFTIRIYGDPYKN